MKPFYITTTLPYVNSDPHVGFAMEIVQADIIARYHALIGDPVFFNTGTDEHGVKVHTKAQEAGEDTQAYADRYAARFKELKELLNLYPDLVFIRTTDAHHKAAAQEFWKRCAAKGDIYKKNYQTKYCIGCELEKTDSELVDGKCPIHPTYEIEHRDEENYFFALSRYQEKLVAFFKENPEFVTPAYRLNEMTSLIEREGLEDFSISRLKSKMPWGVPVPGDEEHVMYVWFDALVNYISTAGWPDNESEFSKWWPGIQVAGKDQVRQQAVMWQGMLMSAGLPLTKRIFIHGFITSGGQKMSKSIGNVIEPKNVVEEYGIDALRYYIARELHPFEDSDFTMDRFKEAYNSGLANGLGNLVSRVMKMAISNNVEYSVKDSYAEEVKSIIGAHVEEFQFNLAADAIWGLIQDADKHIQENQPFKAIKDPATEEKARKDIAHVAEQVALISALLVPFLPETAAAIHHCVRTRSMPEKPLFIRKD